MHNISAVQPLRNSAFLLLIFQLFRFISIKVQHKELVGQIRGNTDIYDETISSLDKILFFAYVVITFILILK
jgi:hypothetical protein